MNVAYVICVCVIGWMQFLVLAQNVGESCQVARSGATGICKVINDCQPVIDEIINQNLFPAQCGFHGRDQIVCCPVPVKEKNHTTPAPTRTSQRSWDFLLFFFSMVLNREFLRCQS